MVKKFFKDSFNLFYPKLRFQKGLMLLEVLIVVAIILVLTSIVMVSYREGQKKVILERVSHKLAQDIRTAEEMVLSGRECPECGGTEPNGYGIYFEENLDEYLLYADMNGNDFYSENDVPPDAIIEIISLEKGVFIKNIDPAPDKVSINFVPPDPKITMKWEGGGDNQTTITIALEADDTKTKTIRVNTAGLIEID